MKLPIPSLVVGGVTWLAFVASRVRHLGDEAWGQALLLFAVLVLVPLALDLFADPGEQRTQSAGLFAWARRAFWPAAVLLAFAYWLPRNPWSAAAAVPWAAWTGLLAMIGVLRLKREGLRRPLDGMCADLGMIYSAVGGAWVLADRFAYLPIRFDATIVALTAVHFHFAGLLLPLFSGLVQRELWFWRFAARTAVGIVLGVPAVALGITAKQLGWGSSIETAAAAGLALAGMAVAILHVRIALEARRDPLTRALLGIAGASLFFGMVLAILYAVRGTASFTPWLGIPEMRLLHGTINAFGFGLCGVLAWRRMAATALES